LINEKKSQRVINNIGMTKDEIGMNKKILEKMFRERSPVPA